MEHAVLAAIASPRRREILRLIWSREMAAGDIAAAMPDVTFGAVSLQLRALQNAGLVVCRPDQQNRFYRAMPRGARTDREIARAHVVQRVVASETGGGARSLAARARAAP